MASKRRSHSTASGFGRAVQKSERGWERGEPFTILSSADLLVRAVSELRTKSRCPAEAYVSVGATSKQEQRAKLVYDRWWNEFGKLNDDALECCEVLSAFGGPGIGTGIREWIKRCTTPYGREHNPWDDALLATIIEEAQVVARLAHGFNPPAASSQGAVDPDLVSLDEAAALVHRSKRTLERHLRDMPDPYVQGGGGKPSLWKWDVLRPWLEREYVPNLPRHFPRNVR